METNNFPVSQWNPDPARLLYAVSSENVQGIEQFRSLRSRLHQLRAKKAMQSILVSSALTGEGRTFVAANLAMALAKQNSKVLLVDADLRKPNLHELFGAPEGPGLAEYLAGAVALPDVIQSGPIENLWLLPGGAPAPDAAELVANNRIASMLKKLTQIFDWIVLDSSPVLPVSDAVTVSHSCDAVLLVARAATTQSDDILKTKREFRDARVLGLVLNEVAARPSEGFYLSKESDGKRAVTPVAAPVGATSPSLELVLRSFRAANRLNDDERRRSVRYQLAVPVEAELEDGLTRQYITTDISEHGLGLRAEQQLELGASIKVTFTLPSTNTLIEARGEIAWSNQDGRCGIRMLSTAYSSEVDGGSRARE
jgi:capsular exopolysaccharide synthesis family protein